MPRAFLLLLAWLILPTAIFANVTPAQLGEFLLKTKYKGVRHAPQFESALSPVVWFK